MPDYLWLAEALEILTMTYLLSPSPTIPMQAIKANTHSPPRHPDLGSAHSREKEKETYCGNRERNLQVGQQFAYVHSTPN